MKRGKKYTKSIKDLDKSIVYTLEEGIKKVKTLSYSSFIGTLEMHIDIKIPKDKDPKSIKGALSLPYSSTKKEVKVAVFCTPDKDSLALNAGANFVGLDSLIKNIKDGKIEFDIAIATPDVMTKIAILGKELGPKGLMPNPKNGTVTDNLEKTIEEYKKGKQTFACDDSGVIHFNIGKLDLDNEKLIQNIHTVISTLEDLFGKPYEQIINKIHLAPTMGRSIKISYSKSE